MSNALLLGAQFGRNPQPDYAGAFERGQGIAENQNVMQRNALTFNNQQDDRQRKMQQEQEAQENGRKREALAGYFMTPPEQRGAYYQSVAGQFGLPADGDHQQIVGEAVRSNPGLLGPELSGKILEREFAPKMDHGKESFTLQEYQFAVDQGYRGSLQDWMREQKTQVQKFKVENPGPAAQTPFDKETAKMLAREMPKIQQAAINAQSALVRLNAAERDLSSASIGTGAGAELAAKRAANFVTGGQAYAGEIQATERVKRILGESALELRNPSGGAGMPGAMSDKDREFLQDMAGRIENQEASVEEVLAARKAIEQRKIRVAQAANDYIKENGQLDSGFYGVLQAIATEPLLDGAGSRQPSPKGGQPPSIQEGATATNPQTGQKIQFRGGQWVPM